MAANGSGSGSNIFCGESISWYWVFRHSTTPMMSQQKLEKTLPLIENAAKILVKDLIKPGKEYDTKEISSAYTIKAIMSSGFSIGNFLLYEFLISYSFCCLTIRQFVLRSCRQSCHWRGWTTCTSSHSRRKQFAYILHLCVDSRIYSICIEHNSIC